MDDEARMTTEYAEELLRHKPTGAELISIERQRQITDEGYTSETDDHWTMWQLADAAMAYLEDYFGYDQRTRWTWRTIELHFSDNPIRNLVKAGALIAAEIDRLQRADEKNKSQHQAP